MPTDPKTPDASGVMTPLMGTERHARLNALFEEITPRNRFQQARLGTEPRIGSLDDFRSLPFCTKHDLVSDSSANSPFGSNLTYPLETYTRLHQTSGTTGVPLRVLDDEQSWNWWGRCWRAVFHAAGITAADRLYFAFSFAPSIGFWSAFKAAEMLGALVVPGGGAGSDVRLRNLLDVNATVLLCTPSYALRLAEVARQLDVPLHKSGVHTLIHAGEPGASVPFTRKRIEEAWNSRVFDHAGATEVGAWGVGTQDGTGLWINEDEFIAEILEPGTDKPVQPGEAGELVLTVLERYAWPVVRYRTGDMVRPRRRTIDGTSRLFLEGGVLGRCDDSLTIRGVNVFPSAIENLVRELAGESEYRATATSEHHMDELNIELEGDPELCQQLARRIREGIGIRVAVKPVPIDSLPRWEAKHRRFVDLRKSS